MSERDDDGGSDRDLLAVLGDETALAVLAALDEPMTANEVTAACDIGASTAYRKLQTLSDAGLCEEHISVRGDGCRVSRYRRSVEELRVAPGDDSVAVETVERERPPATTAARVGAASD